MSDAADAPAAADSEAEAEAEAEEAAEAEAVAAMSDEPAADDAAAQPAVAADDAEDVVDFSDTTPDKARVAEPADDMPADDTPADDTPADDTPADDMVIEGDAPEDAAADEGAPEEEKATEDAEPADPQPSSKVNRDDADASSARLAADDVPDAAATMRLWTDNTGKHQVRARLVALLDGKVRLEKETGRFTTVPLTRLSVADLAFVRDQTPVLASAGAEQTASLER